MGTPHADTAYACTTLRPLAPFSVPARALGKRARHPYQPSGSACVTQLGVPEIFIRPVPSPLPNCSVKRPRASAALHAHIGNGAVQRATVGLIDPDLRSDCDRQGTRDHGREKFTTRRR